MRDGLREPRRRITEDGDQWQVEPPATFTGGVHHRLRTGRHRDALPAAARRAGRRAGALRRRRAGVRPADGSAAGRAHGPRVAAESADGRPCRSPWPARPACAAATVTVDASASSQFVSGLLLVGARLPGGLDLRHDGPAASLAAAHRDDRRHAPRPARPGRRLRARPLGGRPGTDRAARDVTIEPDLSNAAPFLAAAAITGGAVTVPHWPGHTHQPGDAIRDVLTAFGAEVDFDEHGLTVRGTNRSARGRPGPARGQRADPGGRRGRRAGRRHHPPARHRPHPRPRDRPAGRAGRPSWSGWAATSTRPTTV